MENKRVAVIVTEETFELLNNLITKDDLKKALEENNAKLIERVEQLMSADFFPIKKNEYVTKANLSECLAFLRRNQNNLSHRQISRTLDLLETITEALIGYHKKYKWGKNNIKISTEQ